MKTIEDGHIYELNSRFGNGAPGHAAPQLITFVNREAGHEHDGTTTQEVIRSLIDRTQYCDQCLPWDGNKQIVQHLRMALAIHEARAMLRKVERGELRPELMGTTPKDHHWPIEEDLAAPHYSFESLDRASTNTGGLEPGTPCHTPVEAA